MNSRFRLFTCALAFSVLLPIAASARAVSEIVIPSAPTVTRANFLSWSFEVLDLSKGDGSCTLPYARFPRGLKATLCAAQLNGALQVFGSGTQYPLSRPITRGEALVVLTALLNTQEESDVSSFKDVKTDLQKQAVANALALKWMVPVRANLFGTAQRLTGSEAVALLTAVKGGHSVERQTITIHVSPENTGVLPRQDLFNAVWQIINRDYVKSDKIDADEAAYKAIEAMVNALGDPYSNFFRPTTASDFQSQIKGEISGIGAQIESKSGAIIIVAPLPGSPAERAGLMTGDQIVEASGAVLMGMSLDKAVSFIRGPRGTYVDLLIRRSGSSDMKLRVKRDLISLPEIQVKWQGDIAVVQLSQFGETTEKQIRSIFADVVQKNPRGIVLDLRNNGGGLLTAADTVVSNFLPRGSLVAKVQSRSETTQEKTQDDPTVPSGLKTVVLVNKGSASASEIVAGALQDNGRATIVGTQSFGKGTVQEVISFKTGEGLKLTIAQWLTPLGRPLDGIGVKPDIIVEKTTARDEQMEKALDILR